MKCTHCKHELAPGAKFCPECGTEVKKACPNPDCTCEFIPDEAQFCPECGTRRDIDVEEIKRKKAIELELSLKKDRGKKRKRMLAISFLALIGTGLVIGLIFWIREIRVDRQHKRIEQEIISEAKKFIASKYAFPMITIHGGEFLMGSEQEDDEKHIGKVRLSTFKMAKTEVTQAQWQAVMEYNPSYFRGSNRPVENVSWVEAQAFIKKLNLLTGLHYRLPTEAEWEYAAGGGETNRSIYAGCDTEGELDLYGWYNKNSHYGTERVGGKRANQLGLYDMTGNVGEWCSDWYYKSYYYRRETDPSGPTSGSYRVIRGGSLYSNEQYCPVANRYYSTPDDCQRDLGFRLVLVP